MIVSSTFLTAESLKYIFQNSIYFTAIGSLSLYKSMSKITKMRMFAHIRIFCSYYVTFSPSRSVRCETKEPPAMRVRIEGYTKKTPNAIQLRCSSQL